MFNIALNTFREIIRNRFLSLIFFLIFFLFWATFILDTLSLNQTERVVIDFGLSFIELSGFLVILLLGGGMITREIEGRTIYLLLSKPISRSSILIGKFLWFSSLLVLLTFLETLCILLLLWFFGFNISLLFFIAIVGILLKLLTLLALILFFSTFISPILALFMTIASYIIGHSGYVVLGHALTDSNPYFHFLARVILWIFPNLESLNLKNYVATDTVLSMHLIGISFLIAIGYTCIITLFWALIFQKRSFDNV